MDNLIVSTDRLIQASDARSRLGQLVKDVSANEGNYYVILDNGKVSALIVNPRWLKNGDDESFPNLEEVRENWNRYSTSVSKAMENIAEMEEKDLPALLK